MHSLLNLSVFLLQMEIQPVGKGGMGDLLPNTGNTNLFQHTDDVRYYVVFVQTRFVMRQSPIQRIQCNIRYIK
jgi:hypothetical protein